MVVPLIILFNIIYGPNLLATTCYTSDILFLLFSEIVFCYLTKKSEIQELELWNLNIVPLNGANYAT